MIYRIMYRMKVTAIIPNVLIKEVKAKSGGKTITESLIIALSDWLRIRNIEKLNKKILLKPLQFSSSFSAETIRSLNRQ